MSLERRNNIKDNILSKLPHNQTIELTDFLNDFTDSGITELVYICEELEEVGFIKFTKGIGFKLRIKDAGIKINELRGYLAWVLRKETEKLQEEKDKKWNKRLAIWAITIALLGFLVSAGTLWWTIHKDTVLDKEQTVTKPKIKKEAGRSGP